MSYEYTVSIPAGKRAQFRAMVKQLGGRVIPKVEESRDIPNEETIAAMKEVESGVELETLDIESFHQFVAAL